VEQGAKGGGRRAKGKAAQGMKPRIPRMGTDKNVRVIRVIRGQKILPAGVPLTPPSPPLGEREG